MSPPPAHRSLPIKTANAIGEILRRIGLKIPTLNQDRMIEAAIKTTGLQDFGGDGFLRGMTEFLKSLEQESQLNLMGRLMANMSVMEYLSNRLRLQEHRKQNPEVCDEEISRPLVIVGLPRTGTTILFNMLAMDPNTRAPLCWEMQNPFPPPRAETYRSDPRIEVCRRQFANLDKMEPALKTIHEFNPQWPQECVPIFRHEFLCMEFNIMYHVPGYQDWLFRQDIHPALHFHKRFLQHLQSRYRKDRWVLKSPLHLLTIEELLDIYPDACIIQTHRDPVKVMPSLASLSYVLQGLGSDHVDPHEVGRQQMGLWSVALRRAVEARRVLAHKSDQFFDVQFEEIVKDPLGLIRKIYAHFNMPLETATEHLMENFLAANPQGKFGKHNYSNADFGISEETDYEIFRTYCQEFKVPNTIP